VADLRCSASAPSSFFRSSFSMMASTSMGESDANIPFGLWGKAVSSEEVGEVVRAPSMEMVEGSGCGRGEG
jgi:hypothetical protein